MAAELAERVVEMEAEVAEKEAQLDASEGDAIKSLQAAIKAIKGECKEDVAQIEADYSGKPLLPGITAMLQEYPECEALLWGGPVLPMIAQWAGALEGLVMAPAGGGMTAVRRELRTLHQGVAAMRTIPLTVACSLLAHVFIGTLEQDMPEVAYISWSVRHTLMMDREPCEVAKLRMLVHYFERAHSEARCSRFCPEFARMLLDPTLAGFKPVYV
jgi:hypothetical protein